MGRCFTKVIKLGLEATSKVNLKSINQPPSTNSIGLRELIDTLNATLVGHGLKAPMPIIYGDLCPVDETNYLDLPVRCRCGW